ncbi:hypothetical protein MYSTI_01839 [Myxococcus stipitatus DSM 14675]|uniref:Uncharacterized protein n=1 Tax=Myxococcus stipitatus (strain DSM 14675 / JCM 12634 / Mx s8) TaxID=1278073 RepID=L7U313_MYXSD|nr:hypothetical protein MYSTI_01839 [Myxococcus stipitatus DSM 14675]
MLTWFELEDDGGSALTSDGVEVDPCEDGQQVLVEADAATVTGLRAGGPTASPWSQATRWARAPRRWWSS